MSATLVQHTYVRSVGDVDSVSVAFGSNVTAGNTIIAPAATIGTEPQTGAVTDTLSNSYARDVSIDPASSSRNTSIFRASGIAGGACTVTLDVTGTAWQNLVISEWSGMAAAPLDGTATGEGNDAAPVTGSFSPSGPCTIIGMLTHDNITISITPGATYTQLDEAEDFGASFPFGAEYKQVAAGTYTADWSVGSTPTWVCCAAAYLDVAGQPSSPPWGAAPLSTAPSGQRAGW